ncbi:hypothetical protein Goari_023583 [Gossypium aridum]|uniref:Uncharacterized protein n=1 Tax=Gossypium aridum TaxID=34290 RepID=A0A7J8X3F8_GOSAI|nr:hypothetical protein [Gossypium aridum]
MAVFFGLEKPLISQVMINEKVQRVEFEALPASNDDGKGKASNSVDIESTPVITGETFDPWMVVECKSRRNQANNEIQNSKNTEEILVGSRLTTMNLLGKDSMRLKEKGADFMGTRSHIGVVIGSEQVEAQTEIIEVGGQALGDSLVEVY